MAINQNHADHEDASSKRKRPKSCAHWSDLNHDVLFLVMMKVGFGDYYSFRGVCKSWRLLAHSNKKKFIESRPPMSITFCMFAKEKKFYLEDFEGRKLKTILPWFCDGDYSIGVTCGYLIFSTSDFWLVNPITRHQLHFPDLPIDYLPVSLKKAIVVFSPSLSRCVFVVLCRREIWFCIEGKGVWKHVPYSVNIRDLCAFKGKIYTLTFATHNSVLHKHSRLCELRLNPDPQFSLLETRNPWSFQRAFVSSCDNLYVVDGDVDCSYELDLGEMKWVKQCAKRMKEYAFFDSVFTHDTVAVRQESWADPRSRSHGRYAATRNNGSISIFTSKFWYFPHECMNVDCIDE